MSQPPPLDPGPPQSTVAAPRRRVRLEPRAVITGVLFVAIIGLAIWYLARPEPLLVQGEAESTRTDIAARVSGRLAKIAVARGQNVDAGATLLVIDNPELVAELRQAEAEKTVADAELERIRVGTRSEIIAQRKAEIDRAAADLTLAQQTYERTRQLAARQFAPQSKLDEDTDALTLAQRRLDQAKLAHEDRVRDSSLTALLVLEIYAILLAAPLAAKGLPIARAVADGLVLAVLAMVVMLSHRWGAIVLILLGLAAVAASLLLSGEAALVLSAVLRYGGDILAFS